VTISKKMNPIRLNSFVAQDETGVEVSAEELKFFVENEYLLYNELVTNWKVWIHKEFFD
jgi:hypothetical protein